MDLPWIILTLLAIAAFAYFEWRAFKWPARQDTLSMAIYKCGSKWPTSLVIMGIFIGGLVVHFTWNWCPAGSISIGSLFEISASSQPIADPPPTQTLGAPQTVPPAATQNTITTTGPVTSDTKISVGTLAGEVLTWIVDVFGVPIGGLLTAILWRLLQKIGVSLTDDMRARLQEIIINGINHGARKATDELHGRGQVEIKNAAVEHAVDYVQLHGIDEMKALGIDPNSNMAVDAIKARIETAITDVNTPTPKVLDPPAPTPAPAPKAA